MIWYYELAFLTRLFLESRASKMHTMFSENGLFIRNYLLRINVHTGFLLVYSRWDGDKCILGHWGNEPPGPSIALSRPPGFSNYKPMPATYTQAQDFCRIIAAETLWWESSHWLAATRINPSIFSELLTGLSAMSIKDLYLYFVSIAHSGAIVVGPSYDKSDCRRSQSDNSDCFDLVSEWRGLCQIVRLHRLGPQIGKHYENKKLRLLTCSLLLLCFLLLLCNWALLQ